ncbi:DEKNAAC100729 [Brettanomyces naardenensis]|uniref:DNA-directed RNA polymerase III subunit RPC6 n=1 Tax=Brettanomyces naardenensis TaxID=13370 RepID=A0A448YGJ8_BRENA|nr:DEKNAAC100729 [Brettanomyces naardenensis]
MSEEASVTAVSEGARLMHEKMIEDGKLSYSQEDLMLMMHMDSTQDMMKDAQELLNRGLLKILESTLKDSKEKRIMFAPISEQEAQKVNSMTNDEAMIYSHIAASGREGIWTKTLKAKTNLHQHVVLRCLKALESQSYIKSVKSVKHPQRKIYMLYHLTPSIDVTGGPWFTDSELDTDFIDSLLIIVWKFVASKTYPRCFKMKGVIANGLKQYSYPSEILVGMGSQLPTLGEIGKFIAKSGVTTVELGLSDIKSLCDVLVYDEKLELVNERCYKATWQSVLEAGGGRIEDVDIYAAQDDQIFNIGDTYRTMEAVSPGAESNADGKDGKVVSATVNDVLPSKAVLSAAIERNRTHVHFYLDSWSRI